VHKAGTITITASQSGNNNYNAATSVMSTLTVAKAELTAKANDQTREYKQSNPAFTISYSGFKLGDTQANITEPTASSEAVPTSPPGTYPITLSGGSAENYNITLDNYNPGILTVTCATIALNDIQNAIEVTTLYNQTISVSQTISAPGGITPYTYQLIGNLPAGISPDYSPDGIRISGTSTVNGKYRFTVKVTDAYQCHGERDYELTVSCGGITISNESLPDGEYGNPYNGTGLQINVTGSAVAPYIFSTSSVIPGMSVTAAGKLTGTPSATGAFNVNIFVEDFNKCIGSKQFTLNIAKAELSVTARPQERPYNTGNPELTYILSGVKFSSEESQLHSEIFLGTTAELASPVGIYPITLVNDPPQTRNYEILYRENNLTVTKASQTISFPELAPRTYGDTEFLLGATASSGLAVEYALTNPSDIEVLALSTDGKGIIIKNAGTATITAKQEGNSNYLAASSVSRTLTVNKASLHVWAKNTERIYGEVNTPFELEYNNSDFKNGDTETSLSNPPVATCDANNTSPVNNYPIRVIATVEQNYTYVVTQSGILTVKQAPLTIKADNVTRGQNMSNPSFTYTCTGLKNGEIAANIWNTPPTLSTTARQNSPAGDYPVEIEGGVAQNYEVTQRIAGVLTISGKPIITVSVGNTSMVYGDQTLPAFSIFYSGFETGEDENSLDTKPVVSTNINKTTPVSSYEIYASGGADDKYDFNYVAGILTIEKAPLTAIIVNKQKVHGVPDPEFTFEYITFRNGENESVLTEKPVAGRVPGDNDDVGNHDIVPISCGSAVNYEIICPDTKGILTVVKADQVITGFNDLPVKTCGDNPFRLNATASSGLEVSYTSSNEDVATISSRNQVTVVGAGTTIIRAYQEGNSNYNPTPDIDSYRKVLTVNKISQTIVNFDLGETSVIFGEKSTLNVSARTRVGDTNNPGLPITFTSSDPSIASISNVSTSSGHTTATVNIRRAGTVNITASQAGDNNHEAASNEIRTLTIRKGIPRITYSTFSQNIRYGGAPVAINASVSAPELSLTCSSDNESVAVVDGLFIRIVGVGIANIIYSCQGNDNYTSVEESQRFTVLQAPLTITADDKRRQIGQENPEFTASYAGFVNEENESVLTGSLKFECPANESSPVGSYPIGGSGLSSENYTITYVPGILTVTNKPVLQVSVRSLSRNYGEENPEFVIEYSGFIDGDTEMNIRTKPTVTCDADIHSKADIYPIIVSGGSDQKYDFNYVRGTLTVNKAILTVTADDNSRFFGENNPDFSVKYSGFKLGQDESVLDQLPEAYTEATLETPVGTAEILVSGGFDDCYDFIYVSGTLTITAILYFEEIPGIVYGDDSFELPVSVNGGVNLAALEVNSSSPGNVIEISYNENTGKWMAEILSAGMVEITFIFRDGQATATATANITVRKAILTATAEDVEWEPGNSSFPEEWEINYSGFVYGEGIEDIEKLPVATCTARPASPPGDYAITVSGGESRNYELYYQPGTLRIFAGEKQPTAFTPNGDGINDVFAEGYKVKIFNRLGVLLYEGDNGWDGTYKGRLVEPGVYLYIAISRYQSVQKGTVEIIRTK
jgi:gliding motility-associated-like protein